MRILLTGGAGFIGSCFARRVLESTSPLQVERLVNLDKLTYAGHVENLTSIAASSRYLFQQGDVVDETLLQKLLGQENIDTVVHMAAESHVDRSILNPDDFIITNVLGTAQILKACLRHWQGLTAESAARFRLLYLSTDEVFGSLAKNEPAFSEDSPHRPNSPYAASKAAADHLVRAYINTYQLPTIIVHCSNNYGPHQLPEKFIPLLIDRALKGQSLPIYGDGQQRRDWLFVEDHVDALMMLLQKEEAVGQSYGIGGGTEMSNIELARLVCSLLDNLRPKTQPKGQGDSGQKKYGAQITLVADRPGHDERYAINSAKIQKLGWRPRVDMSLGLARTIDWYINNPDWLAAVSGGAHQAWIKKNYQQR